MTDQDRIDLKKIVDAMQHVVTWTQQGQIYHVTEEDLKALDIAKLREIIQRNQRPKQP